MDVCDTFQLMLLNEVRTYLAEWDSHLFWCCCCIMVAFTTNSLERILEMQMSCFITIAVAGIVVPSADSRFSFYFLATFQHSISFISASLFLLVIMPLSHSSAQLVVAQKILSLKFIVEPIRKWATFYAHYYYGKRTIPKLIYNKHKSYLLCNYCMCTHLAVVL